MAFDATISAVLNQEVMEKLVTDPLGFFGLMVLPMALMMLAPLILVKWLIKKFFQWGFS